MHIPMFSLRDVQPGHTRYQDRPKHNPFESQSSQPELVSSVITDGDTVTIRIKQEKETKSPKEASQAKKTQVDSNQAVPFDDLDTGKLGDILGTNPKEGKDKKTSNPTLKRLAFNRVENILNKEGETNKRMSLFYAPYLSKRDLPEPLATTNDAQILNEQRNSRILD